MNVLVLFGSKSDAYLYEPLKESLMEADHSVDFRLISVHRSPELLDKELAAVHPDVVVAGAGLAAHLPGIIASKVLAPVLALPCTPAMGGTDALLSMIQMPFGIPVLTTAPDRHQEVRDFLESWQQANLRYSDKPVTLVVERNKQTLPNFKVLQGKLADLATKAQTELVVATEPAAAGVNICLVEVSPQDPAAPLPYKVPTQGAVCINVPVAREDLYRDPQLALYLRDRIASAGGFWVGVNMVGNGFLAGLQLANAEGGYSAFLTNAKKGYIHE